MNTCSVRGSLIDIIQSVLNGFVFSIIAFCIVSVLNMLTLKKINSQRKFRIKHQRSKQGKSASMNSSLTMTMFAVCAVFVVTTLPGRVILIVLSISEIYELDLMKESYAFMLMIYPWTEPH